MHQFHYHNWKAGLVGTIIHAHKLNNMRVSDTIAAKTFTYKIVLNSLLLFIADAFNQNWVYLLGSTNNITMFHCEYATVRPRPSSSFSGTVTPQLVPRHNWSPGPSAANYVAVDGPPGPNMAAMDGLLCRK